jgi:hypothetical protein
VNNIGLYIGQLHGHPDIRDNSSARTFTGKEGYYIGFFFIAAITKGSSLQTSPFPRV